VLPNDIDIKETSTHSHTRLIWFYCKILNEKGYKVKTKRILNYHHADQLNDLVMRKILLAMLYSGNQELIEYKALIHAILNGEDYKQDPKFEEFKKLKLSNGVTIDSYFYDTGCTRLTITHPDYEGSYNIDMSRTIDNWVGGKTLSPAYLGLSYYDSDVNSLYICDGKIRSYCLDKKYGKFKNNDEYQADLLKIVKHILDKKYVLLNNHIIKYRLDKLEAKGYQQIIDDEYESSYSDDEVLKIIKKTEERINLKVKTKYAELSE